MDDYEKNYQVFDIETSSIKIKEKGKKKVDKNKRDITLHGLISKRRDTPVKIFLSKTPIDKNFPWDLSNTSVIICHNIKFDLGMLWENKDLQEYFDREGGVWCTQVAENLLKALTLKTQDLSLKKIEIKRWGVSAKIDVVTKCFKRNKGTDIILNHPRIPEIKRRFTQYCIAEGGITERLFLTQYKEAKSKGMVDIIKVYSLYALAQAEEEHNGLYFDEDTARGEMAQLYLDTLPILDELGVIAAKYWDVRLPPFNLGSPKQLSALFYGGVLKGHELVDTGMVYGPKAKKAGQRKMRKREVMIGIQGFKLKPKAGSEGKVKGVYSVPEATINKLAEKATGDLSTMCVEIIKHRKLKHKISHFYEGPLGVLRDSTVYHKYTNAGTTTGRVTANKPNPLNQPPEVRHLYTSRYGEEGMIVEFDFSQIEVVIQAYLSGCIKMLNDIVNGMDFHCMRLAYAVDKSYEEVVRLCQEFPEWMKKRTTIGKPISFGKAFGAFPPTISRTSGMDVKTVEKVFEKEDIDYPEISQYYGGVKQDIINSSRRTDSLLNIKNKLTGLSSTEYGEYQNIGYHQTLTGKLYAVKDSAVRGKFGLFKYWPQPDIFNYPIQGTAADCQAITHVEVWRFMRKHKDKGVMVNEVYDSKILDLKKEHMDWIIPKVYTIMKDIPGAMLKYLGIKWDAPIKVDIDYGPNWGTMEEYII